ncbi:SDR family oxidoreductase [Halomonas huangheensis]|uniref:Epimerase n=1 Tax=Halomonas huangheensis TaxID=1178482 RepID=W1N604_9GAMM|nr:SDR family oxidoreductase [Halomonas huangheensis]ALM54372.1 NAD(P)-dependent oxidoreductase [Halomonas huangheensis]ERL50934.1 epimerase [Halomonas huangheensis]
MKTTTLILGCGDIGTTLGRELIELGHKVIGVRRRAERLADTGIEGISIDLNDAEAVATLPDADIVVYTVTADRFEEAAYRAAYPDGLKQVLSVMAERKKQPKHVFFVSSTSVYAQQEGEVVDEHSATQSTGFSGVLMREAEQALVDHALPGTVVRFSGIYGPGRDRLIRQVSEGRIAPATPPMYSNRIHRDDCAGAMAHLITRALKGEEIAPIYLASDTEPAPLNEVMTWLAKQLKVESTDIIQSPLRRRASKRCDSSLLVESGYRFRYPTYREGYAQVLKEGGFLSPQRA